jgi:hypothetical protein
MRSGRSSSGPVRSSSSLLELTVVVVVVVVVVAALCFSSSTGPLTATAFVVSPPRRRVVITTPDSSTTATALSAAIGIFYGTSVRSCTYNSVYYYYTGIWHDDDPPSSSQSAHIANSRWSRVCLFVYYRYCWFNFYYRRATRKIALKRFTRLWAAIWPPNQSMWMELTVAAAAWPVRWASTML